MVEDQRRMSAPAQLARGASAAVVAVGSAVLAHTAAGHHSPHLLVAILALAVSVPLCVQLSGTALSRRRLAGAVLSSQAVLHGLFALFPAAAVGSSGLPSGSHDHHGGSGPSSIPSLSSGAEPAVLSGAGEASAHSLEAQTDPTMVLAHLLAALAAFGLLRFGDTLVQAVADQLSIAPAMMLLDVGAPTHRPPGRPVSSAWAVPNTSAAWLGAGPRTLRGPPVLVKQTHTTPISFTKRETSRCTPQSTALPPCASEPRLWWPLPSELQHLHPHTPTTV